MKKTAFIGTAQAVVFSVSAVAVSAVAVSALVFSMLASSAFADGAKTLADGVYTQAQAEAGAPLFTTNCSACHNTDFYKTTLQRFNGQPLLYLFESIMAGMPADKPGALLDNEYEDIMAHIISLLGFPAGDERLTYSGDTMRNTTVIRAAE